MKQMIRSLFVAVAAMFPLISSAADGDTIWVNSHQNTHWDWNGSWFDTTSFPESGTYHKILMHYTLGCPSIGCSEWDYTTKIEIGDPINDSTMKWYELVRIITPYAGDRQEGWTHEWVIDVTDYAPLLTGERVIRAHYGGWQDGFTVTIDFEMIEGTPSREVLAIDQIYHGTFRYGFSNDPIESHLVPTEVDVHADMESAKFRWVASGHSFGGNENCAEFCQKYYKLYVNNSQAVERDIWRDDCGANPVQPQTGTWVYNRAGWCPGSETTRYDDEIGHRLNANATNEINVDMEGYTYTGGAGFDPQWIVESVLFQYGPWQHENDVAIEEIYRPSMMDQHRLMNPICADPKILIRNVGSEPLTRAVFKYWVEGGFKSFEHEWKGILLPNATAEVELPTEEWHLYGGYTKNVFHVEALSANDEDDLGTLNNQMKSTFEAPVVMPSEFIIAVNNNNAAGETSYRIEAQNGDVIFQNGGFSSFEVVQDTVELEAGCYTMIIEDTDCDGLNFFANSDGNGRIWLHPNSSSNFFPPIHRFDSEFGCGARLAFTVGYELDVEEVEKSSAIQLSAFPNPSKGDVRILADRAIQGELCIIDQHGRMVRCIKNDASNEWNVSDLSAGVYTAMLHSDEGSSHTRFVVIK